MNVESVRNAVNEALSEVIDPETGLDIMRMELIHDVEIGDRGKVSLVFRPSSPVCPMAYTLANSIKTRLESLDKVSSVSIRVENFQKAAHLEGLLNKPKKSSG